MQNSSLFAPVFVAALTVFSASRAEAQSNNPWKPVTDAIVAGMEKRVLNYNDLFATLSAGKSVRGVFDYKKCEFLFLKQFVEGNLANPDEQTSDAACKLAAPGKPMSCYGSAKNGMDAVGGMKLETWEQFGPGITGKRQDKRTYLAASETKLISIRGFVLNYGSVRAYDDGEVLVKVAYLDPRDYAIKMDEMFRCRFSNGSDEQGASFFVAR
ncbi:MAG: hypothetical protein FJY29_09965 [Betaproteobacteria bacterium]|nr:hypothetical protein [Betaproteobacteria bacterium]